MQWPIKGVIHYFYWGRGRIKYLCLFIVSRIFMFIFCVKKIHVYFVLSLSIVVGRPVWHKRKKKGKSKSSLNYLRNSHRVIICFHLFCFTKTILKGTFKKTSRWTVITITIETCKHYLITTNIISIFKQLKFSSTS